MTTSNGEAIPAGSPERTDRFNAMMDGARRDGCGERES
jgi:hypothetical protein